MTSDNMVLEEPPRPSATVVFVRDGEQGLEVLMQRRSENAKVHGGLYVFPGGKLEKNDSSPEWDGHLDGDAATLRERLGEPDTDPLLAQGLFLAALRETFEEAGVLLVEPLQAGQTPLPQAELVPVLLQHLESGLAWQHALQQAGVRWQTQALLPWSRWITPVRKGVQRPRFDTRFFLARLPEGQEVQHDNHEAVESVWFTPRTALQRYAERQMELLPPQILSLIDLLQHGTTESLWRASAARRPPQVLPVTLSVEGQMTVCYPGDPLHPDPVQVIAGPTRMHVTASGPEPIGGFAGWVDSLVPQA